MATVIAKRVLKGAVGLATLALHAVTPSLHRTTCILMYHRVCRTGVFDPRIDAWNVTPTVLERHIAALAETTEFLFVRELLGPRPTAEGSKRTVCLTFDDGYRNFHDEVLPILRRYNAKATAFVVTGFVGSKRPMSFDRWGIQHSHHAPPSAWQPLGWPEIETCVASGLVEIGGHSHVHANAANSTPQTLRSETESSRHILRSRLGDGHALSYAYPYGSRRLGHVTSAYVDAVKASGYQLAVSTNLGLVDASSDRYELPRVEVNAYDGPAIVRAKVAGSLAAVAVTDRLRRAQR